MKSELSQPTLKEGNSLPTHLSFCCFIFQCRAGLVPGPDVLKVIEAFKNETNFTVWNDLIGNMAGIGTILQYADCHQRFKAFCIALYGPIMDRLGWDPVKGEGRCACQRGSSIYT